MEVPDNLEVNSTAQTQNHTNPKIVIENKVVRTHLATGVPGLDTILAGGFLNRSTYVIVGASGTGKTVLTQQVAFNHARQGHKVLYLTFLSESHEKMLSNLTGFSFFDRNLVGNNINYFSLYHEISTDGIGSLVTVARETVLKYRANLVVMDGVSALRDFAGSRRDLRKELFDLNAQLSTLGCTVLLIVDDKLPPSDTPEYGIADGIIWLRNEVYGRRHVRSLEVLKARGAAALGGSHYFDIKSEGLVVYPRTEAALSYQELEAPPSPDTSQRFAFGIPGLDEMVSGGLLGNTLNVMIGAPGNGKTLIGLRFLYEGARQNEKTMVLTFQHPAEHLKIASTSLGFDLSPYIDNGSMQVLWLLPLKRHLDEVAQQLIQAIKAHQPTRLLIDTFDNMEELSLPMERLGEFWVALITYLRTQRITTLGTLEFSQVIGSTLEVPDSPVVTLSDSILFLRTLEIEGQLRRAISIIKLRDSGFDSRVCEFVISDEGLRVGEPFDNQRRALRDSTQPQTRSRKS